MKSPTLIKDMDSAYTMAGGRGRYQTLVAVFSWISIFSFMSFTFAVPYFLIKPPVVCQSGTNYESCSAASACAEGATFQYTESRQYNFMTEFDLLCHDAKSTLISSAFFLGSICSCLVVNTLSDIIGRLPMLMIGNMGNVFALIVLLVFPSFEMTVAVSGLIGLLTIGNNTVPYSYVYDSFHSEAAIPYGTAITVSWSVWEIVIALVMATGASWRTMCIIIMLISSSSFVFLLWIRESPRFYFSKGRYEDALATLRHVADINGVQLPADLAFAAQVEVAARKDASVRKEPSVRTLFAWICCSAPMLAKVLMFSYGYTTSTFVYYALSLNLDKMSANIYFLGVVTAAAEIVAAVFSSVFLERVGKKLSLCLYFVMTTVGIFGLGVMWYHTGWSVVFAYVTKFGAVATDNILSLFVAEMYPTPVKSLAFGIAVFVSRFADVMSKPLSLLSPIVMCTLLSGISSGSAVVAAFFPVKAGAVIEDSVKEEEDAEKKDVPLMEVQRE